MQELLNLRSWSEILEWVDFSLDGKGSGFIFLINLVKLNVKRAFVYELLLISLCWY